MSDNAGFMSRAHAALIWFGGFYVVCVMLMAVPIVQRNVLFAHNIRWPPGAEFDRPEKYGLAPNKTINLNLTTPDNVRLGAWFVFSDAYYQANYSPSSPALFDQSDIRRSVREHPTILYFHGNAATRAVPFRANTYSTYSTRLGANVFVIDYRGFADSEGIPSEVGLGVDARTAWNWLEGMGAKAESVTVIGQSLGTGVATKLVAELTFDGIRPSGMGLVAPFTSIPKLLSTYYIGGVLPLLQPMHILPYFDKIVQKVVRHPFNTIGVIDKIQCPILLIHADDDSDIQPSYSVDLFNTLLEPMLPPMPFTQQELMNPYMPYEDREVLQELILKRREIKAELIKETEIESFGRIRRFDRGSGYGDAVLVQTRTGGHNLVASDEGVVDLIGRVLVRGSRV